MNINNGTYAGRLTRDVEVRTTSGGLPIANIGLAINRRVKKDGKWVDKAVFIDVTIFGKRGEAFARFHSKGDVAVFPRCELDYNSWEDKATGKKRSRVSLIAQEWEFAPGGKREERVSGGSHQHAELDPKADEPF